MQFSRPIAQGYANFQKCYGWQLYISLDLGLLRNTIINHTIFLLEICIPQVHSSPKETQVLEGCISFGEECISVNLTVSIGKKDRLNLRFFWGSVYYRIQHLKSLQHEKISNVVNHN